MRKRRIATLIITLASSIFLAQCERNSLYTSSDNSLSLFGLELFLPPSQVNVQVGGVDYHNGSTYSFGMITLGSSSAAGFTMQNIGTENITLLGVSLSGADPADFPTTDPGTILLMPGDSVNFNATFSPSAVGLRSAMITIDTDAGSYSIFLLGSGTPVPVPDIDVRYSGTSYPVGSLYTFPSVPVSGTSGDMIFTIENTGASDLTIFSLTVGGANPAEFSVSGPGATIIPAGSNTTFTISFNPAAAGLRSAELTISSDDPDEDTYNVYLEGTGVVPEIDLLIGGTLYSIGGTFNFGERLVKGSPAPATFTIQNLGSGSLTLTGSPYVIDGGANAGDLVITGPATGTIASGASTTFTVAFVPSAEGPRTATITIPNTDSDEGSYVINLTATGIMPVMLVNGNNTTNTSVYNPITNTFSTGNPVGGPVARGGLGFLIPSGANQGYHLVLHGNITTANSLYNPSTQTFTLNSNPVANPVGYDAHGFPVTGGTNAGNIIIVSGSNSTSTSYFNPSTNLFSNGPVIIGGGVWWGSFSLPASGGNTLVVCGNSGQYTSLFDQATNIFNSGPNIFPTGMVSSGGHGFLITAGTYAGMMLVIMGNGTMMTRFYDPSTTAFSMGPSLSAIASTGALSIPITSGVNTGRVLIVHAQNTNSTSLYNTDGTIVAGPVFTGGNPSYGALSFKITGGAYNGMFMIILGGPSTLTTIFDPFTLNFITGTGDDLPNPAGFGAHAFPAK